MNSTEEYLDSLLKGMTEESAEKDASMEDILTEEIPIEEIPIEEIPIEEIPIEDMPTEDTPIGDLLTDDFPLRELETDECVSEEGQLLEDEDIATLLKSMGEINQPTEEESVPSLETNAIRNGGDEVKTDIDDFFAEEPLIEAPVNEEALLSDEEVPDEEGVSEEIFLEEDEVSDGDLKQLIQDADLLDLLADMSDDAELSEISELLVKNDNHELIEGGEFASDEEEMPEEDFLSMALDREDESEEDGTASADTDKEGKKKQKAKKSGFFSRLFSTLSQEVEEPEEVKQIFAEETAPEIARQGAAQNEQILNKLSEEEDSGKKEKKPKKEKKIKEKPVREPLQPMKKLPKKKMVLIGVLCFSLGVVMTLLAFVIPYYNDIKDAKVQYQQQNYEKTYELLRGHKLGERDQLIYDRSVILLKAERKYASYKNYMLLGMKLEALNALIQGVKVTEALSETAAQLGVKEEFDAIRNKIIAELENAFAVSLEQAYEWLQIDDNQLYSIELDGYVNGVSSEENAGENTGENTEGAAATHTENSVIKGEEEEFAPTGEEQAGETDAAAAPIQEEPSNSEDGRSTQNVEELNENVIIDVEGADGL